MVDAVLSDQTLVNDLVDDEADATVLPNYVIYVNQFILTLMHVWNAP